MREQRIVVVGGGAAGFFSAITCAEAAPHMEVRLLEKGPRFLAKVRISGGGRCNVTHSCFDPRALAGYYPRGGKELLGPFHVFQPSDTIAWFEQRGVRLKTEPDGRIFPSTDRSKTVLDCLTETARRAGVKMCANCAVEDVVRAPGDRFLVKLANGETLECERLMLATGGCRGAGAGNLAVSLGHTLRAPVPSLFTFHLDAPWLGELAGLSVPSAIVAAPSVGLAQTGAVLVTHAGLSGPAILRLSAWGAREFHQLQYQFLLRVNWLPGLDESVLIAEFEARRRSQAARFIVNSALAPLPARLWERLVLAAGIERGTAWSGLSHFARHRLIQQLQRTELQVIGKTLNKEEFVTCGGVPLNEVNLKTMQSRITPGLYFGGELLDIDGLTGGFNFQAAWTTGWIAGCSMAA